MNTTVLPEFAKADLILDAIPNDERLWVPQADNVWFRPLLFDTVGGSWHNLLRVRRSGILSRHRHPGPVYGYVVKGKWHYLEHDFIASAGRFLFEPPGETHTLIVDDDDEMITLFHVNGAMIYLDENDRTVGYDDVFSKLDVAKQHYQKVGLGANFVEQFIR